METLASVPTEPPAPRRGRARRILARIVMVFAGLAVGLVLAELAFRWRDGGAFPHLNIYVADPALGVRLRPGATEKLAFGGNPITSIRINQDGFRGADLPPPGADDVLVVGDSQVFGLGVEEDQTFSAHLAASLHRTVINAGVPTYGPGEYRAVIAEQLAKRHPRTVVLTLTMANDLFEVEHPNKGRHAVWDGWAVRKETAPASVTEFPGRAWLFSQSHLFFALRRWWHRHDVLDANGFASEGTWHDLVAAGTGIEQQHRAQAEHVKQHAAELAHVEQDLRQTEDHIDDDIRNVLVNGEDYDDQKLERIAAARANPGDIVYEGYGESSRPIAVTADEIRAGAAVRAQLRGELTAWAKAHRGKDATAALSQLAARDQLQGKLTELDAERLQAALQPPLADYLRDVHALVAQAGARLVVVIVPLDVQVSPAEWAKYGHAPIDMTPTRALTGELVATCRAMGVSVLDGTAPLAAAEPGAFLHGDIHMSPKGHAALAEALAQVLAAPPPAAAVESDRSPVPVPAVWQLAPEVIVAGSTAASCETKRVREWLRVLCAQGNGELAPTGVTLDRDDTHEAMAMTMPHGISLLIPLVPGDEVAATVTWPNQTRVLHVRWPGSGGDAPQLAFDRAHVTRKLTEDETEQLEFPQHDKKFASPVERAICDCWNRLYGGERDAGAAPDYIECGGVYGTPDAACVARYAPAPAPKAIPTTWPTPDVEHCEQMLACVRRDPASPP